MRVSKRWQYFHYWFNEFFKEDWTQRVMRERNSFSFAVLLMAGPFFLPVSIITSILLFCEVDVNEIYTYLYSTAWESLTLRCVRVCDSMRDHLKRLGFPLPQDLLSSFCLVCCRDLERKQLLAKEIRRK